MPSDPDASKPTPKPPSTRRKPTQRPDLAYPVEDPQTPPTAPKRGGNRRPPLPDAGQDNATSVSDFVDKSSGQKPRRPRNAKNGRPASAGAAGPNASKNANAKKNPNAKKRAPGKKPNRKNPNGPNHRGPNHSSPNHGAGARGPNRPAQQKSATAPGTPASRVPAGNAPAGNAFSSAVGDTDPKSAPGGSNPPQTPGSSAGDMHLPIIIGLGTLAAVYVLLQGLSPTGNAFWDAVLSAGFAFAVVLAGSRAVRDALLALTLVAFVFVGISWWLVPAGLALGVVVWMMQSTTRRPRGVQRMIRAAITATALMPLMNLRGLGFTGSASILAAIATIPVLYTGYQAAPDFVRSRIRVGLLAATGFVVVASVLSLAGALAGRPAAEVAIQRANSGLEAARKGDQVRAVELLEEAEGHFDTASSRFGAWWASPARLIPVIAQNSRALEVAANQGGALSNAAVRAATSADVDKVRGSGGSIDVPIVREVASELAITASTLNNAQTELAGAQSVWLLPIINDRLVGANEDLVEAADDVNLAAEATAVLPGLLGAEGARTYLVIFTNPAESREFGGFGGAYALLEAVDGKVSLLQSGRGGDLNPPAHPVIPRPGLDNAELYPPLYVNFGQDGLANYFGNLTGTIDFPTIATAAQDVMPKKGLPEIDGLMIMDPFALAAVMELINQPVRVPDLDEPLTADNVADYLLRGQYTAGSTTNEREDVLGDIAQQVFSSLLAIETPGPERLGAVFGPVARQRRMQFTTFDVEENAFLERVFLRSRLPQLPEFFDYISVISDTAAPNKLDAYLRREIVYDVQINPATGRFDGTVDITLHNEAPAGLPEYVQGSDDYYYDLAPGVQRERVSIYSSNDVFGLVLHDGVESSSNEFFLEYGLNRRLTFIDIPRGASRTVTMTLVGTAAPGSYTIYMAAQPRTIDDSVVLNVTPTEGWVIRHTGEPTFTRTFDLVEDTVLGLEFSQT